MSVPDVDEWLTGDFLGSCLQSDETNFQNISVTNHTVEPAVAVGNNYGSYMLRVKIQYKKLDDNAKEHSISLIIKTPMTDGYMEEFNTSFVNVYDTEPKFYNGFINETYKLCKHNIVPKHYTSQRPSCVVMEDLRASGYVMVDRQKLLDFDHCRLYIKASARRHALSVAVHKKNPELIESLGKANAMIGEKGQKMIKSIHLVGLRCLAAYLEDKPHYKKWFDVIKEASDNDTLWDICQEIETSRRPLMALTQGDPWCTNMMFKYSSAGEVVVVKLLDFQYLRFTTPVMEFIIFVWLSANPEVRNTKLNELYRLYCDSLNGSLAELGCSERLSFEELQTEITFLIPFVLHIVFSFVPICTADEAVDMNSYFNGGVFSVPTKESSIYKLYLGINFNNYFPVILDQLEKQGIFDYMKETFKHLKQGK